MAILKSEPDEKTLLMTKAERSESLMATGTGNDLLLVKLIASSRAVIAGLRQLPSSANLALTRRPTDPGLIPVAHAYPRPSGGL